MSKPERARKKRRRALLFSGHKRCSDALARSVNQGEPERPYFSILRQTSSFQILGIEIDLTNIQPCETYNA